MTVKKQAVHAFKVFIMVTAFCIIFAAVYEHFSHGVYSLFMMLAWVWPFVLGALPMLAAVRHPELYPPAASRYALYSGIATLTTGSIVRGILDIYGTTNALTGVYWAAGILFLAAAFLLRKKK